MLLLLLLVVLVVALLPHWPYARNYPWVGYYPSSFFGLVLLIVVLLMLFDALPVPRTWWGW